MINHFRRDRLRILFCKVQIPNVHTIYHFYIVAPTQCLFRFPNISITCLTSIDDHSTIKSFPILFFMITHRSTNDFLAHNGKSKSLWVEVKWPVNRNYLYVQLSFQFPHIDLWNRWVLESRKWNYCLENDFHLDFRLIDLFVFSIVMIFFLKRQSILYWKVFALFSEQFRIFFDGKEEKFQWKLKINDFKL